MNNIYVGHGQNLLDNTDIKLINSLFTSCGVNLQFFACILRDILD